MSYRERTTQRVVLEQDGMDVVCDTCNAVCPGKNGYNNRWEPVQDGWLRLHLGEREQPKHYCSRQCAAPQPERPYAGFFGGDQ